MGNWDVLCFFVCSFLVFFSQSYINQNIDFLFTFLISVAELDFVKSEAYTILEAYFMKTNTKKLTFANFRGKKTYNQLNPLLGSPWALEGTNLHGAFLSSRANLSLLQLHIRLLPLHHSHVDFLASGYIWPWFAQDLWSKDPSLETQEEWSLSLINAVCM